MQLLKNILEKINKGIPLVLFVGVASLLTIVLFHIPFFGFVLDHVDSQAKSGMEIIIGLTVTMLIANAFVFYIISYLSRIAGKVVLIIFFILNSVALYFVNKYNIILDESMIGNVLNTNFKEATSFLSPTLFVYILLLGILPSVCIYFVKIKKERLKVFIINAVVAFVFIIIMIFTNSSSWLWIDKYSTQLGGLTMPWSYSVNIPIHYVHKYRNNRKEIPLPDATIKDNEKAIVVLVIGESARRQNFSLYGYDKNTNPLLSKTENIRAFKANSCATYTRAGIKCILEHENTDKLYEILPNYLYRNGVDVVWRTTNWGEPPIHIEKYQNYDYLHQYDTCNIGDYDEILTCGLKETIRQSDNNKILIILHTSTSHGPSYSKKYPPQFETFSPVCNSVELGKCSAEELMNAYDNTIVYTDYILHKIIDDLKSLTDYKSTMIFVSDHGESLGEKNLYMHGVPMKFAPKEQYEIPFIVWVSDSNTQVKNIDNLCQNYVFHSVLKFLSIQSPVYKEDMNIFE